MPKFKVGDKVKVISETHGWGEVKVGDIGVIKRFDGYSYIVNFPNLSGWAGGYCWFCREETLELAEEFKKEIKLYGIAKFCNKYYK